MKGYVGEARPECGNFYASAEWNMPSRDMRIDDRMQLRKSP